MQREEFSLTTGGSTSSAATEQQAADSPRFTIEKLSQEFAALSEEERFRLYQAKYGLAEEIHETPHFVADSLRHLQDALDDIEDVDKEAYETAMFINPEHVSSKRFNLAFLRATDFNIMAAAQKIISYWEKKLEIFGPDRAFHSYISLVDFEEEDYHVLASGPVRVLPFRDDVGRALIFENSSSLISNNFSAASRKLLWLMLHIALFDDDSRRIQKKELTLLLGNSTALFHFPFDRVAQQYSRYVATVKDDVEHSLPVKDPIGHVFVKSTWALMFYEGVLDLLGGAHRQNMYFYSLNQTHSTLQTLANCGIQNYALPWELGGTLEWSYQEWLYDRLVEDAAVAVEDENNSIRSLIPGIHKLKTLLSSYDAKETASRNMATSQ